MVENPAWVVVGTLALGFSVLMVVYALRLVFILVSSRRWIAVPARLIKADIKHRTLEDRSLRGEKLLRQIPSSIHAEYVYESAGNQQRGRAVNLLDVVIWGLSVDRRDIEALRAMSEQIEVWIDPKQPARAVIFRRLPVNGVVALALLLCMSATVALLTAEATVGVYGSPIAIAIAALVAAGVLHPIVRGLAHVTMER